MSVLVCLPGKRGFTEDPFCPYINKVCVGPPCIHFDNDETSDGSGPIGTCDLALAVSYTANEMACDLHKQEPLVSRLHDLLNDIEPMADLLRRITR